MNNMNKSLSQTKIHKSPGHEQHEQKLVSYKQFSENLAHDMPKEHEFKWLSFQLRFYKK